MWSPTQNFGPIGSDVLTFIGYKQTDKQTEYRQKSQSLYIYISGLVEIEE